MKRMIAGAAIFTLAGVGLVQPAGAATAEIHWGAHSVTATLPACNQESCSWTLSVDEPNANPVVVIGTASTDSQTATTLTVALPPFCGVIQADISDNGKQEFGHRMTYSTCEPPPTTTTTVPPTTTTTAPPTTTTTTAPPVSPPTPPVGPPATNPPATPVPAPVPPVSTLTPTHPVTETLTAPAPAPAPIPVLAYTGAPYGLLALAGLALLGLAGILLDARKLWRRA